MSFVALTAVLSLIPLSSYAVDPTCAPLSQDQINDLITYFTQLVTQGDWAKIIEYVVGTASFAFFSFSKYHVPGVFKSIVTSVSKGVQDPKAPDAPKK